MRKGFLPEQGAKTVSGADTRLAVLRSAALGAVLMTTLTPAASADAMPLREAEGLVVTCLIEGLPRATAAAAASSLCARAIEAARRGAPYPVGVDLPPDAAAPRLTVRAAIQGATPETRTIRITAELARPGQPATPRRVVPRPQPVAFRDWAAVDAALDAALAAVLPWRSKRDAQVPSPPRAY